jgi:hypothetical protein
VERAVDRGPGPVPEHQGLPDRAKLVDLTNKRFTAVGHPDGFGATKAAKILDVVHKRLCPSYPMG